MPDVSQNLVIDDYHSTSGVLRSLTLEQSDFQIKRLYWISKVPPGEKRGMHAHKKLRQIFVCLSGQLTIKFDDGLRTNIFRLDETSKGLTIQAGLWRELYDFSSDSLLLVICDENYYEDDYIRDYDEFIRWKASE